MLCINMVYIVILVFTSILTGFVTNTIQYNIYVTFLIRLIICIFVPNIIFLILFFRSKEFKYLFKKLRGIIIKSM